MSATPPKRVARRERVGGYSSPSAAVEDEAPGTPGPTRARINHLENQVRELVRKTHAAERKHRAEMTTLESKLADRDTHLATVARRADEETRKSAKLAGELERCKTEGVGMRQELNLYSLVQQQKAVLALADEQLQIVELEQRLLKAESERVMRDHKLVLFQSREDDMLAEVEDKASRIAELEEALQSANTSLAHQRAAERKAAAVEWTSKKDESRAEAEALQAKLAALEEEHAQVCTVNSKNVDKYQKLKEREKEAQAEIKRLLSEERPDPAADSDKAELKAQLRAAKVEAAKRTEEASDLAEELSVLKETSKEREKALKAKYREAQEERNRLAAVEVELEALKAANAKAAKVKKEPVKKKAASRPASPVAKGKARKTSPTSDSDDEPPKKKAPKASTRAKSVLADSDSENTPPKDADSDAGNKSTASIPDKKKKRKLFGVQTAFQWDPVLNSGDGVIPTFLSPVRPAGASGTIPRAGLGGISARNLSRF
ncbi:Laminin subunit beta-2 [Vanrija pseudolonga]|uniref:Laminin subunit beta-2 n=1 Tax=Vanrija pseudolonga TaxID=143232 RepID=A0AAF0Y893_9TREE|nr:Laminin subunit beta-2 [Vanrija pseudolonga]